MAKESPYRIGPRLYPGKRVLEAVAIDGRLQPIDRPGEEPDDPVDDPVYDPVVDPVEQDEALSSVDYSTGWDDVFGSGGGGWGTPMTNATPIIPEPATLSLAALGLAALLLRLRKR